MIRECSNNTVFGFTETWFTNEDDILFYKDSKYYSGFKSDRMYEHSWQIASK